MLNQATTTSYINLLMDSSHKIDENQTSHKGKNTKGYKSIKDRRQYNFEVESLKPTAMAFHPLRHKGHSLKTKPL